MRFVFFLLFVLSASAQEAVKAPVPEAAPEAPFRKMYILNDLNLMGFDWKDLGLERSSQFTAPLLKNWEKWLNENRPDSVGEVLICEGECLSWHSQWEERHPEELISTPHPGLENIVWLKVSLTLRRTFKNNIQGFAWDGRVLLLDGNTKKSLATVSLPREEKEWFNTPQGEINSALVSRVYRTPLGAFPGLMQKLEKLLPLNRVIKLTISGHRHLGDVMKLSELLQTRGSSLGLQVEMGQFGSQEAVMKVYYRGEEKSFTDLLSQVKELKSSYNYSLVNEVTGTGLVIRMVKQ